jgi:hypothetical protein
MRRLLVLTTALVLTAAACSGSTDTTDEAGSDATSPPDTAATADPAAVTGPQWLFVLDATGGTSSTDGDTTTLTLTGVEDGVVAFTDRPDREVSTETPAEFVGLWDERGFADTPPNAALDLGNDDIVVVEITDPTWDVDTSTLTMGATVLDPDTTASGQTATTGDLPASFGAVSLFVDAAGSPSVPTTVEFEYTGTGNPSVFFEQDLAPLTTREWFIDVSGVRGGGARITTQPDEGTTIFIDAEGDTNTVIVTVTLTPATDGKVYGFADLDEGETMKAEMVQPRGSTVTVTAATGQFTLTPNG